VKSRRTVTPGTGALKSLNQLLFPGFFERSRSVLSGPPAYTNFRNEISRLTSVDTVDMRSLFGAFSQPFHVAEGSGQEG
jgi:hypothetical protein